MAATAAAASANGHGRVNGAAKAAAAAAAAALAAAAAAAVQQQQQQQQQARGAARQSLNHQTATKTASTKNGALTTKTSSPTVKAITTTVKTSTKSHSSAKASVQPAVKATVPAVKAAAKNGISAAKAATKTVTTTQTTKTARRRVSDSGTHAVSTPTVNGNSTATHAAKKPARPPARRQSLREPSPEKLLEDEPPTATAAAVPSIPVPGPIPVVATKGRAGKSRKSIPGLGNGVISSAVASVQTASALLQMAPSIGLKPKWSNGWAWEGPAFDAKIFLTSDEPAVLRKCYPAMRHAEGDIIARHDCVLLKSGPRRTDLPFVAKVAALWENPDDGEMMVSLLWYYRPEHTEQGRRAGDVEDEIFASRHKDTNSVACIEDKCYVLTFNEYCRYKRSVRRLEEGVAEPGLVVPKLECYPRRSRQPPGCVAPDMVFFCRRVYDFRQRRILKNPG